MDNEKEIKKAYKKFKQQLREKKKEWHSIRIDKHLEAIDMMHNLMSAGIDRNDAKEIAKREATEDEDEFRFIARQHIEMKHAKIAKELGLTGEYWA